MELEEFLDQMVEVLCIIINRGPKKEDLVG